MDGTGGSAGNQQGGAGWAEGELLVVGREMEVGCTEDVRS